MGKIFQLDDQLSNKIAAGEVVERPASVVKELVENAIDASSSQIRVDIEEGGLSLIRVLDDGDGLEEDDLETAFYRHATSKIRNDKDLFRIATLGFRGEALPSIASVAKVTMKTSNGGSHGSEIKLEGGKILHKGSSPPRKGTEIAVSELFYNTPARLKYLRTIPTELGHISDVLNRMALAHPEISFHLTHNGKPLLKTAGNGDLLRVIAAIYGSGTAKKMLPLEAESLDFKIEGYMALPEVTRSNRSYMTTIINGRYIRSFPLMKAVQEGFHTLLPIGKFPIAVLKINMDPILIDVNVHPSKLEVRLSKEQALQELVTEAIKKVFQKTRLIPEVNAPRIKKQQSEQLSFQLSHDAGDSVQGKEAKEQTAEYKDGADYPSGKKVGEAANIPAMSGLNSETEHTSVSQAEAENAGYPVNSANTAFHTPQHQQEEQKGSSFNPGTSETEMEQAVDTSVIQERDSDTSQEELEAPGQVNSGSSPVDEKELPVMYPIGQLHGTYILAQNENGLYIIDQHAAQERINYEYYREKLAKTAPELQDLLVPLTVELTQAEEERVKERGHLLEKAGIVLEPFGSRTYLVRSHPAWFPKGREQELIEAMLEQVKDKETVDIGKLREEAAILMSCKSAIKANRYLTKDEIFRLLETLRTCEEPYTCPHGRPVIIQYSTYEMERMFKRIM
ncbi:DNA mismatch repair endonuclease MutL [Evansella clarkii]|uniref:DNA mismatch repair endonuclease MutL n=1 Tax=Evansella clarkii TaxID=79879 RepID=UPI00099663B4|nr:DNA mismatch repair endonuclease MutL [Evansella clarkii]